MTQQLFSTFLKKRRVLDLKLRLKTQDIGTVEEHSTLAAFPSHKRTLKTVRVRAIYSLHLLTL